MLACLLPGDVAYGASCKQCQYLVKIKPDMARCRSTGSPSPFSPPYGTLEERRIAAKRMYSCRSLARYTLRRKIARNT